MHKEFESETPLSESNVSLKLSLIQKRCSELMLDDELGLSLEDNDAPAANNDPYNSTR